MCPAGWADITVAPSSHLQVPSQWWPGGPARRKVISSPNSQTHLGETQHEPISLLVAGAVGAKGRRGSSEGSPGGSSIKVQLQLPHPVRWTKNVTQKLTLPAALVLTFTLSRRPRLVLTQI